MQVKCISKTEGILETIYTACKTCYSDKIEFCDDKEKMLKLVNQVAESGHLSTFEHANFTFAISGISRACSHQLVRHRHCSFSQQSQRYVDMSNLQVVEPKAIIKEREADSYYNELIESIEDLYKKLLSLDIKKEDARCILPNATSTNLIMTCNLRQLIHLCNLRLCNRAQLEIRNLFKEIVKIVLIEEPWLKKYLVPQCEKDGFCKEHNCCGRKKTLKELLNNELS